MTSKKSIRSLLKEKWFANKMLIFWSGFSGVIKQRYYILTDLIIIIYRIILLIFFFLDSRIFLVYEICDSGKIFYFTSKITKPNDESNVQTIETLKEEIGKGVIINLNLILFLM